MVFGMCGRYCVVSRVRDVAMQRNMRRTERPPKHTGRPCGPPGGRRRWRQNLQKWRERGGGGGPGRAERVLQRCNVATAAQGGGGGGHTRFCQSGGARKMGMRCWACTLWRAGVRLYM